MNRVYVTQAMRGMDYQDLEQYGEVVFLTNREYPREPSPDEFKEEVLQDMMTSFKDYKQGEDWIALTYSPMSILIMGIILGANLEGEHRILKWNNRREAHDVFKIKI